LNFPLSHSLKKIPAAQIKKQKKNQKISFFPIESTLYIFLLNKQKIRSNKIVIVLAYTHKLQRLKLNDFI